MQILRITTFVFSLVLAACTPIINLSSNSIPSDVIFNEYVGQYPLLDIFGNSQTLSINPDKTFHFIAFTDTGMTWEQDGNVEMKDGKLNLIVNSERYPLVPKTLVPVKWGMRSYLIEADKINSFCESVKKGDEPRNDNYGFFYVKDGDWNIAAIGKPISPEGKTICPQ